MLGAIIGDIVGSRFEMQNNRSKDFEFFSDKCTFTDDSVMTIAVAHAVIKSLTENSDLKENAVYYLKAYGRLYPDRGYGMRFFDWIFSSQKKPYNSFGNGAAMRVSPCGFLADSINQAIELSRAVTEVTHNHPEGIKGAEATAVCIYLAKTNHTVEEIREYVNSHYYKIDFKLDDIRESYLFNETCQETVPQAIEAFLESTSFEDAIRNAISIGGDSDTIAAITGGIAEAFYGIPDEFIEKACSYLDVRLNNVIHAFYKQLSSKK